MRAGRGGENRRLFRAKRGTLIALPMRGEATVAGGWGFHRLFRAWLTARGIAWTSDYRGTAILVNGWAASLWRVAYAKARGARIVHRLDGSGAAYGRQDGRAVDRRMRMLNKFADVTIYQSNYARYALRGLGLANGWATYNPVDLDLFRPVARLFDTRRPSVAVVAWSGNPMKGLDETAAIIRTHPEVDFAVFGPYELVRRPHVHWHGMVTHTQLSGILPRCDALLTFSKNEACPNHVIEALACGVPVLYGAFDAGAIPELVSDGGMSLTDPVGFRIALDRVQEQVFRDRARKIAELYFDHNLIFPRYLQALTG